MVMDAPMEVIGGLKQKMGLEETELRLGIGLPAGKGGGGNTSEGGDVVRKRGFSECETEECESESENNSSTTVDLMLNLSSPKQPSGGRGADPTHNKEKTLLPADPAKPPSKAQVVGWPPVRSFRKNMLGVGMEKKKGSEELNSEEKSSNGGGSMVKVSMDGAPYLRKVDLKMYNSYQHLSDALANMFSSFTIGNCGSQGLKDFMNESKLMDLLNSSDYVPTYEDKDGDWMLVGDVPWDMFVESCKRLRIMKGKEAIGLAPRAMEKCKNRS